MRPGTLASFFRGMGSVLDIWPARLPPERIGQGVVGRSDAEAIADDCAVVAGMMRQVFRPRTAATAASSGTDPSTAPTAPAAALGSLLRDIGALTQSPPPSRFSLVVSEWKDDKGRGRVVTLDVEGERIARFSVSDANSGEAPPKGIAGGGFDDK